jgi:hypothetical protein
MLARLIVPTAVEVRAQADEEWKGVPLLSKVSPSCTVRVGPGLHPRLLARRADGIACVIDASEIEGGTFRATSRVRSLSPHR